MACSSRGLESRWAFGPKELKNIQTLVTLTTVAMETKNPPQLVKHLKGYGILSGGALGGTGIVAIDFCYHGNHCVALWQPKKWIETHRTLLTGSVETPLTRPSETVKALI